MNVRVANVGQHPVAEPARFATPGCGTPTDLSALVFQIVTDLQDSSGPHRPRPAGSRLVILVGNECIKNLF
jgi:hypothetical protein